MEQVRAGPWPPPQAARLPCVPLQGCVSAEAEVCQRVFPLDLCVHCAHLPSLLQPCRFLRQYVSEHCRSGGELPQGDEQAQPEPQRRASQSGEAAWEQHIHGQGPAQVCDAHHSPGCGWVWEVWSEVGSCCLWTHARLGRGSFPWSHGFVLRGAWVLCSEEQVKAALLPCLLSGQRVPLTVCTAPEPGPHFFICGAGVARVPAQLCGARGAK